MKRLYHGAALAVDPKTGNSHLMAQACLAQSEEEALGVFMKLARHDAPAGWTIYPPMAGEVPTEMLAEWLQERFGIRDDELDRFIAVVGQAAGGEA